jgi:hypothetical protein
LDIWFQTNGRNIGYFLSFKIKDGSKYKIKFREDKKIILGGQIYKFTYFKKNFKTFGRTFIPPPMHVGPPLGGTMSKLKVWGDILNYVVV